MPIFASASATAPLSSASVTTRNSTLPLNIDARSAATCGVRPWRASAFVMAFLALLLFSDTTDARPGAVIDVGGAAESCRETSPVGFGSGCVDVLPALKYAGVLLEPGLITRSKTTPSSAYRGGSPAAAAAASAAAAAAPPASRASRVLQRKGE